MKPFNRGDEVTLTIDGHKVAIGTVHRVHPNDTVQNIQLGQDRIGVLLERCFEDHSRQLPYPSVKLMYLSEAIDCSVLWDTADVFLTSTMPTMESSSFCHKSHPDKVLDTEHEPGNDTIFVQGDMVNMFIDGVLAAKGLIFKTSPTDHCHNEVLGRGRISVQVTQVIRGSDHLPYPNLGAELVQEAQGSLVMWNTTDLSKHEHLERRHELPTANSSKDFSVRSNWMEEDVELYLQDRSHKVATGIITCPFELGAVNDQVLGADAVGVMVTKIIVPSLFPSLCPGVPGLVKWSIASLLLVRNGLFLGDIFQQHFERNKVLGEKDLHLNKGSDYDAQPQKRPYNSAKRAKLDSKEKERRRLESRATLAASEASIDAIRRVDCCKSKCCLNMPNEELEAIRQEYHGMSSNNRTSHIFGLFDGREDHVKKQGLFIIKGRAVCREAFSIMHGFSTAKFYQYRQRYEEGCKVGFHGNTGIPKTRETTMHARALLQAILVQNGEPMPHLPYLGKCGTDTIQYRLPSCFTKPQIFQDLLRQMQEDGYGEVSVATLYKIWSDGFENYAIHKGGAFAKCTSCTQFRDQLMREKRKKERAEIEHKRAQHLSEQMSRRYVYYAHKILAKTDPKNYLCIIHDKMDQAKTYLPRLVTTPKSMSNIGQPLPIALTGMLTHGRHPGAYAHFSLIGLWPGDADFTVTSLAKCLRDLEVYNGNKSGDILEAPSWTATRPIFQSLLHFEAFQAGYLEPKKISIQRFEGSQDNQESQPEIDVEAPRVSFKPLPRHLTLQLDNSGKDNKNQFVMTFCSELVSRGVFETVQMSFLMVGHTHEDVDALFSKVSNQVRYKELATLLGLMAEVWECEKINPVPSLIQEVAAYKEYLKTAQVKEIEGHSKPQAFLFSMKNNVPVYQYKGHVKDPWMPPTGRCLWRVDTISGALILPILGQPYAKPISTDLLKKSEEIIPYLNRYMDFLKNSCKDETSVAYRERFPLLKYWERLVGDLSKELTIEGERGGQLPLANGFWPKTNHGTGYKATHDGDTSSQPSTSNELNPEMMELQNEYNEEMDENAAPFVGAREERESMRWIPLTDIKEGHFVFLRPANDWELKNGKDRFWLVRALGTVDPNHEVIGSPEDMQSSQDPTTNKQYAPMFQVQWWRPKHVKQDADERTRYETCFLATKTWEKDPCYYDTVEYWQYASSAMYGFLSRMKEPNLLDRGLKIPGNVLKIVKTYMQSID